MLRSSSGGAEAAKVPSSRQNVVMRMLPMLAWADQQQTVRRIPQKLLAGLNDPAYSTPGQSDPAAQWLHAAFRLEFEGAFRTTLWLLDLLLRHYEHLQVPTTSFLWSRRGRVLRQLGAIEEARESYARAIAMERYIGKGDEGAVSAILGLGSLGIQQGNWREARRQYDRALKRCGTTGVNAVGAHQGAMIVARKQGRLLDAFLHGWMAFDLAAPDRVKQADIIAPLASCAEVVGRLEDALAGYLAVIDVATQERLVLPAISSAIRVGTQTLQWQKVDRCVEHGKRIIERQVAPYDECEFYFEFARAEGRRGRRASMLSLLDRVDRIAAAHRYNELRFAAGELRDQAELLTNATSAIAVPEKEREQVREGAARLSEPGLLAAVALQASKTTSRDRR